MQPVQPVRASESQCESECKVCKCTAPVSVGPYSDSSNMLRMFDHSFFSFLYNIKVFLSQFLVPPSTSVVCSVDICLIQSLILLSDDQQYGLCQLCSMLCF